MVLKGFLRRLSRQREISGRMLPQRTDEVSGEGLSGMGEATGSAGGTPHGPSRAGGADPTSCASRLSIRLSSTRTLRLAPTALASATIGPTSTHSTARTPRTINPSKSLPHRHGRLIHSPNSHWRVGRRLRGAGSLPLPGLCERVAAKPTGGRNPAAEAAQILHGEVGAFCCRREAPGDGRSR